MGARRECLHGPGTPLISEYGAVSSIRELQKMVGLGRQPVTNRDDAENTSP